MQCLFCPPEQAAVHPREPDRRCGRCGERFADATHPGPPPAPTPRRLGGGWLRSAFQSETFSLGFGLSMLFFGVVLGFVSIQTLLFPIGDPPEYQPGSGLLMLLAFVLPLLGGALLLLGRASRRIAVRRELVRNGLATIGLVTSVCPSYETSDGTTEGFIQFRYPTPSGWREMRISNLSLKKDPEVGQPVHVLYDPKAPERAMLYLAGGYHS